MEFEKHFTVEEAQATLPLVKRIVADIQETGHALRERVADLKEEAADDEGCNRMLRTLEELSGELDRIGCDYKDPSFSVGLVDFPAVIDGEEVFLCWRTDEPEIRFYHGIYEGYPGRKPLPTLSVTPPNEEDA